MVPIQSSFAALRSSATLSEVGFAAIEGFQSMQSASEDSGTINKKTSKKASSVVASNLNFTFEDNQEKTLQNVSFEISPGTLAAIIGPSGSGKTTLVDIILGLFKIESGKISIDKFDPSELKGIRSAQIAYVPQKPSIIHDTVLNNITLSDGTSTHDYKRLASVIEATQLEKVISDLPNGLDTVLDGSQARLSGGQIQRIGLARALYSMPKLLILDEATSSLDAETEHFITEIVRRLTPETTVIVIAHRLSTVKNADVVFLLEYGEIKDSGTLVELQKRNPLVERYINLMSFE